MTSGLFESLSEWGRVAVIACGILFAVGWWWRTRTVRDGLKAAGSALIAVTVAAFF